MERAKSTIFTGNIDQADTLLQVEVADTQAALDLAKELPLTQPMFEEQSPKLNRTSADFEDLKSWEGMTTEESHIVTPVDIYPLLEEVAEASVGVEPVAPSPPLETPEAPAPLDGAKENPKEPPAPVDKKDEEVLPAISPVKDWGYQIVFLDVEMPVQKPSLVHLPFYFCWNTWRRSRPLQAKMSK